MTSYTAECHRDGDGWAIEGLDVTVHTQARRLDQVQDVAREAIAVVLDVDESEVDVKVRPLLDHGQHALDAARHAKDVEELAVLGSKEAQALAVIELTVAGLSPHDIGWLLGVSHQRVHHLSQVDRTKVILRTPQRQGNTPSPTPCQCESNRVGNRVGNRLSLGLGDSVGILRPRT